MSETTEQGGEGATRGKRGAVAGYFAAIGRAIATTFEGLSVTSSWFFRRPLTIQYPDKLEKPVQEQLPDGYRGILEVDLQRCTACALCQKTCPIGAVQVKAEKNAATGVREIVAFDIDMGRCMYCGLCSEACKFDALSHTTDFEGVEASPDGLILHFVRKPVPPAKAKDAPPRRPLGSILAETVNPCLGRVRWRGRQLIGTCEDPGPPPAAKAAAAEPPKPKAEATPAPAEKPEPKAETAEPPKAEATPAPVEKPEPKAETSKPPEGS